MYESYWNDGSSASKQPRIIHGVDATVILVSAVYACENRHKIIAHDEVVLQLFPVRSIIPFLLSHCTGFTRDLGQMITGLCKRGINFYAMESYILERRWETHARQLDLHALHQKMMQQTQTKTEFLQSTLSKAPSNDMLSKCFLSGFLEQEKMYLNEMAAVTVTKSISFDHTFKIASNIGYLRSDNKWVSQYTAVFLVLNESGQVLTWQLTNGTSFSIIEKLLCDLEHRSSKTISTVYVDDCCRLRGKIRAIFGSEVLVKLDIFHAVQRVTKILSKKHLLMKDCVRELQLVFRCDGDSGKDRLTETPQPDVISRKLDAFFKEWEIKSDSQGVKLFKSETFHALNNLKKHISSGCLSGIPPGRGTNKNERLHQNIKAYFNRSRIGVLLAYALLMVMFDAHNSSVKISGKAVVRPIAACSMVSDTSFVTGLMPKYRPSMEESVGLDFWEIDVSGSLMDMEVTVEAYCKSIKKHLVKRALQKCGMVHLMKEITSFEEFQASEISSVGAPEAELLQKLSKYGLTYSPTVRDGNCFCMSVSKNIMADVQNWT